MILSLRASASLVFLLLVICAPDVHILDVGQFEPDARPGDRHRCLVLLAGHWNSPMSAFSVVEITTALPQVAVEVLALYRFVRQSPWPLARRRLQGDRRLVHAALGAPSACLGAGSTGRVLSILSVRRRPRPSEQTVLSGP